MNKRTGHPDVRAAGAAVWRRGPDGAVQVVLVHRPRYDDWSLPKGKIHVGEHPAVTAVREVAEETGQRVVLGRPLPSQTYEVAQGVKSVHYWSAYSAGGTFVPGSEVDEILWLDPDQAAEHLTHRSDQAVLAAFRSGPPDTRPMVVLRHAQARPRSEWNGPDTQRPLSTNGQRQAAALADLLAAFGPRRVLTSPTARCVQTLEPLLAATGLSAEPVHGLAQEAPPGSAAQAREIAHTLYLEDVAVLLCTHRPVLPALLRRLSGGGEPMAAGEPMRPGELLVIHRRDGVLVATERLTPVA